MHFKLSISCAQYFHHDFSMSFKNYSCILFFSHILKVMGHEFLTKEEFKVWEVWVDSPSSPLPPQGLKVFSPDYVKVDRDTATEDFRKRIKHYEDTYEPLSLEEEG